MFGTPFSLRLERDRGQVFVDVGSNAAGWHKLEYALEFVDGAITQKQLGASPDAAILADLLQARWDRIVHLFTDSQEMSRFETFAKNKTASLLGGIFGN